MKLTILGGGGGYPEAGGACGGYLLEYDKFKLLIDPGYATFPKLSSVVGDASVDSVLITHGHPDHCSDLNPLLRSRILGDISFPPLPVYSVPGATKSVISLDSQSMLENSYELHEFSAGTSFRIGDLLVETRSLPHFIPSVGIRITGGGKVVSYTGDSGFSSELEDIARGADIFLAESTYVDEVDEEDKGGLSSASISGWVASRAAVGKLILVHIWPGTDRNDLLTSARKEFSSPIEVAEPGKVVVVD